MARGLDADARNRPSHVTMRAVGVQIPDAGLLKSSIVFAPKQTADARFAFARS